MENNNKEELKRALRVKTTAELTGVSPNHVNKILRGDRENETVVETYMTLVEIEPYYENALIQAVKKLVPFN